MRKQLIHPSPVQGSAIDSDWLELEKIAQVQITSEEAANPIEGALVPENESNSPRGWVASGPGPQVLRLLFDQPQDIKRINLLFIEEAENRTQEFLLRYSKDNGQSYQEILRQQYTFGPPETTIQREDYAVRIEGATTLELSILPEINGGNSKASLTSLRLA